VELVNPATNEPLRIHQREGKAIKYQIIAKAGYKAPRAVTDYQIVSICQVLNLFLFEFDRDALTLRA